MSYDDRFVTNSLYSNYSRYDDPLEHRLVPNINNLQHWGVSATLEWKLSDALSLKSITAYRDWWNNFGRDSDGTPLPNNATYDESKHRQFTQEIQLTGTGGKLDWAAGAFYYDAHDSNQGFDFLYPTIIYQNDSFDRAGHDELGSVRARDLPRHRPVFIHARRSLYRRPEGRDHLPGEFLRYRHHRRPVRANPDDQHGLHRLGRLQVVGRIDDLPQAMRPGLKAAASSSAPGQPTCRRIRSTRNI